MKLDYEDKVDLKTSSVPRKNKVTADDMNEIKQVVNHNASELLWTNENPDDDFAIQTITLPENNYQFYRIEFKYYKTSTTYLYEEVKVGNNVNLSAIVPYTPGLESTSTPIYMAIGYRPNCTTSSNSVGITKCYQSTTNVSTKVIGTKEYTIPTRIWGFNLE